MWGNPPGVAVTEIGSKKILFSFKDRKKGLQILQNGPWNVRGNLINLRLWTEGESVFEVNHDFMEFWVQVHRIPVDYMSKETTIHIGNMLGVVAEVEDPKVDGVLRRPFLRIRVGINISKALPTGFWLAREKSSNLWVYFQYKRLPDCYCYNCGIIGHEKKSCKNPTAMAVWDSTKSRYSAGLGVSQVRAITSMGAGSSKQGGWKEKDGEETARGQQSIGRGSEDRQDTEESMFKDEQNLQRELREEYFLENQFVEENERERAEGQVKKTQNIPNFQRRNADLEELRAGYIMDISSREIRKNKKGIERSAQQVAEGEFQERAEVGLNFDIRPNRRITHDQLSKQAGRKPNIEGPTNWVRDESTQRERKSLDQNKRQRFESSYETHTPRRTEYEDLIHNNQTNGKEGSKEEKNKQEYKAESGDMYYVELASDGEEEGEKIVENNRGSSG
ncbi:hypothetical protein Ahy_A05g022721 isoform B [Arachis hypogaea]|nr:hypothetical protein Ahy_A05g022721 isoform B [Arachis hypogaea]